MNMKNLAIANRKAGMPAFQQKTHEVRDADTGKLICTLPIYGGGRMPTYRVVINEIYTNV